MKDILMYRAMQNPETSSVELSDKQSEIGRQFSKDALLTKALLNRVGMEGATESDSLSLVNALSPAGRRLYENIYSKNKRQGGSVDYYQTGGQVDKGAYPAKDMEMLKQFPLTYKFFMDRRGQQSYYPEQDSLAARMFRGEIDPNEAFSKALMLPLTQEKGTAPPRRQQEIRNPNERFGPPDSLDYSVKDLEKQAQENFESFMDSLEYRRSLNPFTGKPMDTDADLERLRKRMIQSKIPPSRQRMPMQEGGQVKDMPSYSVSRPEFEAFMNYAATDEQAEDIERRRMANFMSLLENEKRVRPVSPDRYTTKISDKDGMMVMSETEIPKLSEAYMSAFGFATPLSRRQGALLQRKMIAPETLNPSVKGLINRVLVQRLGNENS